MEYQNSLELFNFLKGAFKVKLRLIKKDYDYISMTDIWNYLKINKWAYANNLTLAEMTDDIIGVDITKVDTFLKEHLKNTSRSLYTD